MDRYDEALAKARSGKRLEEIFPELKESEDERIYNEIMEFFRENEKKCIVDNSYTKWIAWLEKQKENIEKEYVFRPLVGTDITIAAEQAIQKAKEGHHLVLAFNGMYIPVREYNTAKELVDEYDAYLEKQKEQKPAEWSEEDEKLLDFWLDVIDRNDWRMDEDFCKASREFINRLKSLRPQPHWMPSEEQMRALERTIRLANFGLEEDRRKVLASLYEQLKKLM